MARYRGGWHGCPQSSDHNPPTTESLGPQLHQIYALIVGNDPRQLPFEFALWTREMVRELIRREFKRQAVSCERGRLLRKLGLSPQRPLWRAYQQNLVAVGAMEVRSVSGHPHWGCHRGGDHLLRWWAGWHWFHAGTHWRQSGRLRSYAHWYPRFDQPHLCMSAQELFAFLHLRRYVRVRHFHQLCKRLMHDTSGFGISHCRRHPVHRSKAVKTSWLRPMEGCACSSSRLTRLNSTPTSRYGRTSKPTASVAPVIDQAKGNLRSKAVAAMRRLQKTPLSDFGLLRRSKSALHRSLTCPFTYAPFSKWVKEIF